MNRVGEHFLAGPTFAKQQNRYASYSGTFRPPDSVANRGTRTDDVLKSLNLRRRLRGQMLQVHVRRPQHIRNDVHKVKGNVSDPALTVSRRLVESGRVPCFPQKQPHRGHRWRSGAEVQTQLAVAPVRCTLQVTNLPIGNLKDAGMLGGIAKLDRHHGRSGAEPSLKPLVPVAVVVAEQVDVVEAVRTQQGFRGAVIAGSGRGALDRI